MKKIILFILITLTSLSLFAGKLRVGASPVPHAELLNLVKEDLKSQGVELEVIEISDYVTPNLLLDDGSLDANYFQHIPYQNKFAEERKLSLVAVGKVHVEPLGLYSGKYKKIEDIPANGTIAIPSDPTNGGRALILLHNNGIIKLKDPTNLSATEIDVIENPKKFKFTAVEAAQLPRVLPDVDAAVINGNYALEVKLNPSKDSLLLEDEKSPYVNVVTVKAGNEKNENVIKLVKALQTDKVKEFILKTYNGGVVPAF
ncbi:MAG: MetQ/NlpA family ABC transporter substrate-binding protein [Fusobacteriaceae bacterium]|jgi:D-methionine transport system substrate-binding protein|nr:MetQ/NlpA family ABC transporter substrate-binding protein [Fusobacteriaceae bacterium]